MSSAFQKFFVAPVAPRNAGAFVDDHFVAVEVGRQRGGIGLVGCALTPLPLGLVVPGFDSMNVQDSAELSAIIRQTSEAAGLSDRKHWSVALPEAASRTVVVVLESKPSGRRELDEIIGWKVERLVATPSADLRLSRQRMSTSGGQERYLVTVAREEVISEYEIALDNAGWRAGMLLPRHIGEAQWLVNDGVQGDRILVSANRAGFTALVIRNGEPVIIRSCICEPAASADELHRFALYYRDRFSGSGINSSPALNGVLLLGNSPTPPDALKAIGDALETYPRLINPSELGFNPQDSGIEFEKLAAAAGLASLALK